MLQYMNQESGTDSGKHYSHLIFKFQGTDFPESLHRQDRGAQEPHQNTPGTPQTNTQLLQSLIYSDLYSKHTRALTSTKPSSRTPGRQGGPPRLPRAGRWRQPGATRRAGSSGGRAPPSS